LPRMDDIIKWTGVETYVETSSSLSSSSSSPRDLRLETYEKVKRAAEDRTG